jgi:hypothetical protein
MLGLQYDFSNCVGRTYRRVIKCFHGLFIAITGIMLCLLQSCCQIIRIILPLMRQPTGLHLLVLLYSQTSLYNINFTVTGTQSSFGIKAVKKTAVGSMHIMPAINLPNNVGSSKQSRPWMYRTKTVTSRRFSL